MASHGLWIGLALALVAAGCLSAPPDDGPAMDSGADPHRIPAGNATDGLSPHFALPDPMVGLEVLAQAPAPGGYSVWPWNDRAYLSTFTSEKGVVIYDIAEPGRPEEIGALQGQFARDVNVLNYENRTAVAISADDDLVFYDVTDPAQPRLLAEMGFRSHNVAVHRPAQVVYNNPHIGQGVNTIQIVDASDPDAIRLHHEWVFPPQATDGTPILNSGCHDLVVYAEVERAYCAAYQQTLIWDLADPLRPEVITAISNPLITVHHAAFTILNHTVLAIGDEFAGAFAWGCYGHPAGSVPPTPLGALWLYDLSVSPPRLLSWVGAPPSPPEAAYIQHCTSHDGAEIGHDTGMIAFGWFRAGILLIDASDPAQPRLVDRIATGGIAGDARYYRGLVLAADSREGLLVLAPA